MHILSPLKTIFLFSLIICFSGSCSSHQNINPIKTEPATAPVPVKNQITFKVNGILVKTSGWTISRLKWSANSPITWLNITTNMHQEKRTITVNLSGAEPGDYSFNAGGTFKQQSHGHYKPDYMGDMLNAYSFESGTFHLTQVDTVNRVVNGTFSGQVKNTKGETLAITDGKILNATLSSGITKY